MMLIDSIIPQVISLARGPFLWAAIFIFIAGTVWRTRCIRRLCVPSPPPFLPGNAALSPSLPPLSRNEKIRRSIAGTRPLTIGMTTVFHVLIIVSPFFVMGHTVMLQSAWGDAWIAFPDGLSHVLTIFILLCVAFFLLRRVAITHVRKISTGRDYLFLLLVASPFATGLLAYYQVFNYKLMITLHMLLGEVLLALLPFSFFTHMLFFFPARFRIDSEYRLGKGGRTW